VEEPATSAAALALGPSFVIRSESLGTHDVFFSIGVEAVQDEEGGVRWHAPSFGVSFVTRIADLAGGT